MPAIEVSDLRVSYGRLVAVDGVSFSVEPGEVFAVLGPNGAGKTTTVEVVEGFKRRDGGSVRVLGHDPARELRAVRGRIGVMPQDGGLYAGIRPAEALRQFAAFYPSPEDPAGLLERVGLGERARTPWRRLSGGERQRLSLALALVGRPEVAFLDEPTAGMDVHGRHRTWELVRELTGRGTAVLLTTHLLDEAQRTADRVAILHRGRVVAHGRPDELHGGGDEIRLRAAPGLDLASLGARETEPGCYLIGGPADPDRVARLTAALAERGVLLRELTVGGRSLEDVFLELTREDR